MRSIKAEKNTILTFGLLVCLGLLFSSCSTDGEDPGRIITPTGQRLIDLAGNTEEGKTYVATSVLINGTASPDFDNFTISLRSNTVSNGYNSTNGAPVFGQVGTWELQTLDEIIFDANNNNVFKLSSINLTATSFRLTVNFTAGPGGSNNTPNEYIFNLVLQ